MALTYSNRVTPEPIGVDAIRDAIYADFPGSGTGAVDVEIKVTPGGNRYLKIWNATTTTIDPNGDTLYDAADIGSEFVDGPGGKFYVKSDATTWTEVT